MMTTFPPPPTPPPLRQEREGIALVLLPIGIAFVLTSGFLAAVMLVGGCGREDNVVARHYEYTRYCIDGVSYLHFHTGHAGGASAEYTPDGRIRKCTAPGGAP